MSYTATLTGLDKRDDKWVIDVLYTDTVTSKTLKRTYYRERITKKQLRDFVRNEATRFAEIETTDIDIPLGATIDVTPDAVTPPTAAEIAEAKWFADWGKLQQILAVTAAVPALATAPVNTQITSLRSSLASGWLNSYLDKI
jgi:hypothetical protein